MIDYDTCPSWVRDRLENDVLAQFPSALVNAFAQSGLRVRYLALNTSTFGQFHQDARGCDSKEDGVLGVYCGEPHMLIIKHFVPEVCAHELFHAWDHLLADKPLTMWSTSQEPWKEAFARAKTSGRVIGEGYGTKNVVEFYAEVMRSSCGFSLRDKQRLARMDQKTYELALGHLDAADIGWLVPRTDPRQSRDPAPAAATSSELKDNDVSDC